MPMASAFAARSPRIHHPRGPSKNTLPLSTQRTKTDLAHHRRSLARVLGEHLLGAMALAIPQGIAPRNPGPMPNRALAGDALSTGSPGSAGDAMDPRVALDPAQRSVERFDGVARQQLGHAGRRVERFGQADVAGIGERLDAGGDVHGLAEVVEI